jgi:hypothetical protein
MKLKNQKICPPGVICIENVTMVFMIICLIILGYLLYASLIKQIKQIKIQNSSPTLNTPTTNTLSIFNLRSFVPSWPYNNLNLNNKQDVLLNPYAPPLRDERYNTRLHINNINQLPINISTNPGAVDANYRQIGILSPLNGSSKDNILALMGRPLYTNRDKWQYYTISNQHNNVKLPLSINGKSGSSEYGVDKIYGGETIYVEGHNDVYKITVYDNDTIRYLPLV